MKVGQKKKNIVHYTCCVCPLGKTLYEC